MDLGPGDEPASGGPSVGHAPVSTEVVDLGPDEPEWLREAPTEADRVATGPALSPEDVAAAIVFLGSPINRQITGEVIHLTGGR